MHTQNISDNTATRKAPERCSRVKLYHVIADQQSLLLRLAGLRDLNLPDEEEEEEVSMLVIQLSENVRLFGVADWSCKKPKVLWSIASFWILGQNMALNLYDLKGARAVEYARLELADFLAHEKYYRDREQQEPQL